MTLPAIDLDPADLDPAVLAEKYTKAELREIAQDYGLNLHHSMKEANMAQAIADAVAARADDQLNAVVKETNANPAPAAAPAPIQTQTSQIMAALEHLRGYGLQINLSEADQTFHFRRGQVEDSGTLKQPLSTIVRCAEMVAYG